MSCSSVLKEAAEFPVARRSPSMALNVFRDCSVAGNDVSASSSLLSREKHCKRHVCAGWYAHELRLFEIKRFSKKLRDSFHATTAQNTSERSAVAFRDRAIDIFKMCCFLHFQIFQTAAIRGHWSLGRTSSIVETRYSLKASWTMIRRLGVFEGQDPNAI